MSESDDETSPRESFVARWARLKRQRPEPAADTPAPETAATADARATVPADADASSTVADETRELPLPSVDDLTPDSDITAFLDKRVPEELRRLAMRRMWTLDPAIRDFIEIAENQYDWNDPNGVPGFGPLPEGTDIEALLAQATGAVKPKPADEREATEVASMASQPGEDGEAGEDHAGHTGAPSDPAAAPDADAAGGSLGDEVASTTYAGESDKELAEIAASGDEPGADDRSTSPLKTSDGRPPHAAAQHRRRHGGALPG